MLLAFTNLRVLSKQVRRRAWVRGGSCCALRAQQAAAALAAAASRRARDKQPALMAPRACGRAQLPLAAGAAAQALVCNYFPLINIDAAADLVLLRPRPGDLLGAQQHSVLASAGDARARTRMPAGHMLYIMLP